MSTWIARTLEADAVGCRRSAPVVEPGIRIQGVRIQGVVLVEVSLLGLPFREVELGAVEVAELAELPVGKLPGLFGELAAVEAVGSSVVEVVVAELVGRLTVCTVQANQPAICS